MQILSKRLNYLPFLFLLGIKSLIAQNSYFKPTNIIDNTNEFGKLNIWVDLKNNEKIGLYTRIGDSIYGGEINCNIKPLKDIDTNSFKILTGTNYAKDCNNVYYPLLITCYDSYDCGVCYFTKYIIEGANPLFFIYLGKDYAVDDKLVFFRGRTLDKADCNSFKVIEGPEYFYFSIDKNYVFKHDKIIPELDSKTFFYDKTHFKNNPSGYNKRFIIGDQYNIWEFIPPNQINKIENKSNFN